MHQNAQICKLNFKKILKAKPPDPHTGEGLRRPSPDLTPLGGPALRAYRASLGAFGPSTHRHPNQKSWIHPWAHPPSENPGYAYARIIGVGTGRRWLVGSGQLTTSPLR